MSVFMQLSRHVVFNVRFPFRWVILLSQETRYYCQGCRQFFALAGANFAKPAGSTAPGIVRGVQGHSLENFRVSKTHF